MAIIPANQVFLVMGVDKSDFNAMTDIKTSDVKLIPIIGPEDEIEASRALLESEGGKSLKIVGVQSLAYLQYQMRIIDQHLEESGFTLEDQ